MAYIGVRSESPLVHFNSVDPSMSPEQMLQTGRADYTVGLSYLSAVFPTDDDLKDLSGDRLYFHSEGVRTDRGDVGRLPDRVNSGRGSHFGTIAIYPDGDLRPLAVVGGTYSVLQNREVLDVALKVAENFGSTVTHVGTGWNDRLFAVKFEDKAEPVVTFDGNSETFTRSLFAYSSHDMTYTLSFAFRITDPENRNVATVRLKRRHTAQIRTDDTIEDFLKRLAEESREVLDDIRVLAVLQMDSTQLEKGLDFLSQPTATRTQDVSDDDQEVDEDEVEDEEAERVSRVKVKDHIHQSYLTAQARYGKTAWALYEAWMAVVMARDQRRQREAYASRDAGQIFKHLTEMKSSELSTYDRKRRGLVKLLINSR